MNEPMQLWNFMEKLEWFRLNLGSWVKIHSHRKHFSKLAEFVFHGTKRMKTDCSLMLIHKLLSES